MNSEDTSKVVVLVLLVSIVTSVIALDVELTNQRCDKNDEREKRKKERELHAELDELRRRVKLLEKRLIQA